jgi:GNAT superfamily N-acetyltransferase
LVVEKLANAPEDAALMRVPSPFNHANGREHSAARRAKVPRRRLCRLLVHGAPGSRRFIADAVTLGGKVPWCSHGGQLPLTQLERQLGTLAWTAAEEYVVRVCQCRPMGLDDIAIQFVDEGNSESAVRFLIEWVCDGEDEARRYLADHVEPDGTSLIATSGSYAVGYAATVWESNYAGFRSRGIPLVHQIAVGEAWRRRGIATLLMNAAEHLARERGIATLGITVGLFDEYGPAQRMYGQRG